jgi:hypothetical protein
VRFFLLYFLFNALPVVRIPQFSPVVRDLAGKRCDNRLTRFYTGRIPDNAIPSWIQKYPLSSMFRERVGCILPTLILISVVVFDVNYPLILFCHSLQLFQHFVTKVVCLESVPQKTARQRMPAQVLK